LICRDEIDLEQTWKKVFRAWREGDVLATVGTGPLTRAEEKEFGLVGDHNYSIFGMALMNLTDYIDMRDDSERRLLIRNPWSRGGIPKSSLSTSNEDGLGTFWVDYPTFAQTFKTLYLNWNPALFQYVRRKHFSFTPNGSDYDVGANGQYTISVEGTGEVWILVERHHLGKSEGWEGYIGLAVFPGNERVYTYTRPSYRVPPSLTFD
jgi:calpain-7